MSGWPSTCALKPAASSNSTGVGAEIAGGAGGPSPGARWRPPAIVLFLLLLFLGTSSGRLGSWDVSMYYAVTESIVTRGAVDIPPALALGRTDWTGRGGRTYAPFDCGQSLLGIPFYLAGDFAGRALESLRPAATPEQGERRRALVRQGVVPMANAFVTAATAWCLVAIAAALGWSRGEATATALIFGVGTMAWHYAVTGYNQPLAGFGIALGLLGAVRAGVAGAAGRPAWILAGAGCGIAMVARLNAALAVPPVFALLYWSVSRGAARSTPRSAWIALAWASLPVGGALTIAAAYNILRFGSPLHDGYAQQTHLHWNAGLVFSQVWALVFSPAKGLLFYIPALLLAVVGGWHGFAAARMHPAASPGRPLALACGAITLLVLLHIAGLPFAHGGLVAWGPRYLVLLMPVVGLAAGAGWVTLRRAGGWRGRAAFAIVAFSIAFQAVSIPADRNERIMDLWSRPGGFVEQTDYWVLRAWMVPDAARDVGRKAAWLAGGPNSLVPQGDSSVPKPAENGIDLGRSDAPPAEKTLILRVREVPNVALAYAVALGILPAGIARLLTGVWLALLFVLALAAARECRGTPRDPA